MVTKPRTDPAAAPARLAAWTRRNDVAVLALVSAFAALISSRVTFGFAGWLWNLDLPKIHYPLAAFFHEAVSAGRLPLWNDRLGLGFPLYAEGQIGAFYPPHWITFLLEPLPAMDASRWVHLTLAGFGIGLLARRVSGSVPGSILAALVGVLGGAIVTKLEWWNVVAAYGWVPWVLLPLSRTGPMDWRSVALAGVAWGVQALTGHPNTWLLTGIAALVLLVRQPLTQSARQALAFGGIGAAIGAVQLLPTLLLQRLSVRSLGLSADELFTSSATPFDVLNLGFANAFTRHASDGAWDFASSWYPDGIFAQFESAIYVGLPVVGLAAIGAVTTRARPWLVLAIGMLLLAVLAAFRPEWWLSLPVLNGIRSPTRAYLIVMVAIAVLAAIGMSRLGRDRHGGRPAVVAVGSLMAVYGLAIFVAAGAPTLFADLLAWSTTGGVDAARAEEMRARAIEILTLPWPAVPELLAGTALAMIAAWRRSRRTVLLAATIAALPLLVFSPPANPVRTESAFSFAGSQLVSYLASVSPHRVLVTNPPGWWDAMPNQLATAGVPDADMFSSLNLLEGERLLAELRADDEAARDLRLLVGIDTTITVDGSCEGSPAADFQNPPATVCRLTEAMTAPFWIPSDAVTSIDEGSWPPRATLDVEAALAGAVPLPLPGASGAVDRMSIEVRSDGAGWVYVARSWWPAWSATVDGSSVPIVSAAGGQLVAVPEGDHLLAFALVPWDVGIGLMLGVVGAGAAATLVARRARRMVTRERLTSGGRPATRAETPSRPSPEVVDIPSSEPSVPRRSAGLVALVIASSSAFLYLITVSERVALDSFLPLADAFLHGRLHIEEPMPWLELIPRPEGGFYTPFPPMPAVVLLPFVILFGPGFDQGIATALFGGANVGLLWLLLRRMGVEPRAAGWLTAAFGVGSVHWWAAGAGSVWLHAQVVAVFFALLALHLTIRRRWPILAGVLIGCAAASRLPMGLTLPLYLALFMRLRVPPWVRRPTRRDLRVGAWLLAGLAVPALLVAAYNVARYGTPTEFGYGLIPGVLDEPWYASGILSIEYIPRHLHLIFMRGFDYVDAFPWFRPNWAGASLVLTMPILLWLVKARSWRPLIVYGWIAVALGMLPNLLHGAPGFAQFGYRFVLDVLPITLLMLGWVFRERISTEARIAIAIGIAVNAYGVWAVTVADFVSF